MIRGLQITIGGEALSSRIAERIRMHEATISALDIRIKQREGDLPFDVRPEDGFKTLGELENERQHYRDRVLRLTLLRDNIVTTEAYVLDRTDLRTAELISPGCAVASEISDDKDVEYSRKAAIDGLKLTMPGEEVRRLLEQPTPPCSTQRNTEHQRVDRLTDTPSHEGAAHERCSTAYRRFGQRRIFGVAIG